MKLIIVKRIVCDTRRSTRITDKAGYTYLEPAGVFKSFEFNNYMPVEHVEKLREEGFKIEVEGEEVELEVKKSHMKWYGSKVESISSSEELVYRFDFTNETNFGLSKEIPMW